MKSSWRRGELRNSLRSQLWPIPTAAVTVALLAGLFLPQLDEAIDDQLSPTMSDIIFGGGADAARTLLSAIAGSLITVTTLTFSLTVVTLQLASSQFSPRLLRTFFPRPFRALHACAPPGYIHLRPDRAAYRPDGR
jgi:uncharacterized membrane protein